MQSCGFQYPAFDDVSRIISDVLALCLFMQGCRDLLISLLDNIDGLPVELPVTCRKALATVQQVCSVYLCVCV